MAEGVAASTKTEKYSSMELRIRSLAFRTGASAYYLGVVRYRRREMPDFSATGFRTQVE